MSEKLKAALENYLENLKDAQLNRALAIENHLKTYEDKLLKIRSVDDYIALSNHQRRCAGLESSNVKSFAVRDGDRVMEVKWQD